MVPLSIHAAGRPRLNLQAPLSELVTNVRLHAAATWGVAPSEFYLSLRGVIMNLDVPLVHYLTGGSVLEAVAPGPR